MMLSNVVQRCRFRIQLVQLYTYSLIPNKCVGFMIQIVPICIYLMQIVPTVWNSLCILVFEYELNQRLLIKYII